jgi:heparanase 1
VSCVAGATAFGGYLLWPEEGASATGPAPAQVSLSVDLDRAAAQVEDRFLSVAIDTAEVVGGEFWAPPGSGEGLLRTHGIRPYDFARPRLRNLARGLAPAYLRIGGSAADWTTYRMDDGATSASAPPHRDGARWTLTRQRWDEVNAFARDLDYRILFTLNAGRSARDADGRWDPESARPLIEYSQRNGYPVEAWELGNEPNAFPLLHWTWLSADRYSGDLRRARALLDELHAPARLAGLATAFWPVLGEWRSFTEDVLRGAGRALDVVTWHYYPQQSFRCPIATRRAQAGAMLGAERSGDVERWASRVESAAHAYAPQAAVWLGETASAQCGGEPGVSDTYGDALWWLDEMGRVARRGQKVVVRQTLSGSDYGLIDDETLQPNPSYWASWLWRRLMGNEVLAVSMAPSAPGVRAYAHCLRGGPPGAVVMLVLNMDTQHEVAVELPKPAGTAARVLRLQADGLAAKEIRLDGTILRASSDGNPPAAPTFDERFSVDASGAGDSAGPLSVPPLSAAFAVLPQAAAAACTRETPM